MMEFVGLIGQLWAGVAVVGFFVLVLMKWSEP